MGYGLVVVGCGKRTCMEWTYGAKDNISTNSVGGSCSGFAVRCCYCRTGWEVKSMHCILSFTFLAAPPFSNTPFSGNWKLCALHKTSPFAFWINREITKMDNSWECLKLALQYFVASFRFLKTFRTFRYPRKGGKFANNDLKNIYVFSSFNNIQTQNKVFFSLIFRNEIHAVQSKMSFNLRACVQQKQNYC